MSFRGCGRASGSFIVRVDPPDTNYTQKTFYILLQPNLRDKLTALEAGVTASLPASSAALPAVLASRPGTTTHTATTRPVNIQKNCGPDNVCVPDLQVGCVNCIGVCWPFYQLIIHIMLRKYCPTCRYTALPADCRELEPHRVQRGERGEVGAPAGDIQ